ncbi:MAG: peptide deformylase [Nitrospiraceae bacterium]|nr:MAG: peptide deformylase [Nitrospiraceae bacterium]
MAILDIRKYPDTVLSKKAESVTDFNADLQQLIDDMTETLRATPTGIGLAAPQVGVSKRLAIIDLGRGTNEFSLYVIINPVLSEKEGCIETVEGCLSIPDMEARIQRYEKVRMRGLNREGRAVELDANGLLAIALQHEIDHLDGLLLINRLSPIKREFFKKRFKKTYK